MQGKRRARELALQLLYQIDLSGARTSSSVDELLSSNPENDQYTKRLVTGCVEKQEDLDAHIAKWSENWNIGRMPVIDRNILRMGVFELLFCDDTPPKVAIDEAIEIAKLYGDADSPGFVNGVLDAVYKNDRANDGHPPARPEDPGLLDCPNESEKDGES